MRATARITDTKSALLLVLALLRTPHPPSLPTYLVGQREEGY
jgi:hypothetical protein